MSWTLICLAAALAMFGATAAAEEPKLPPRTVMNTVDQAVTYQMTSGALVLGTKCSGSLAWADYDHEALLADYRTSRAYLEKYAPGERIFADFEVNRLLQGIHQGLYDQGTRMRLCEGLAPANLFKYRRQPPQ